MLHSVEDICDPTVTLVLHFPQSQKQACFATLKPWGNNDFIRSIFTGIKFLYLFLFMMFMIFSDDEIEEKIDFVLNLISSKETIK